MPRAWGCSLAKTAVWSRCNGLATFAWDAGDEAARRLAAVQMVRLRAASQGQVAAAFGVDPATIWRWDQALAVGGVAGLVPARRGPKGASRLTPEVITRIRALDAAGQTLRQIAAATGVSTFTVRNALGRVRPGGQVGEPGAAENQQPATLGSMRDAVARRTSGHYGTGSSVLDEMRPARRGVSDAIRAAGDLPEALV